MIYNHLQLRELFHIEFLRWLTRRISHGYYALKGGANLRFFFNSFRYSEDIDIDINGVEVSTLKNTVMKILESSSFQNIFKPFGIEKIIPQNIIRAKQTSTTQRFKIHLVTFAREDLLSKIEFSRRGFKGNAVAEHISYTILRKYKLLPLIVSHYDIRSAIIQKIGALATRPIVQARDVFDLYILSSQCKPSKPKEIKINNINFTKASESIFEVSFKQFCDTVVSYLSYENQPEYNSPSLWEEIKLKVVDFIQELEKYYE